MKNTAKKCGNQVILAESKYSLYVVVVNSVSGKNRLPWVLNPASLEISLRALDTLAHVDRVSEVLASV